MDDLTFLQRIFDGYVTTYRRNMWHTTSGLTDMTAGELGFFVTLGTHLGYTVRREMNWDFPRDLCWCETTTCKRGGDIDIEARTVLYLERENHDGRVDLTIRKLLDKENTPTRIPYLIAVLGWTRKSTLDDAKAMARQTFPGTLHTRLMLISWIGEKQDGEYLIEGWILERNGDGRLSEFVREATPEFDKAGYWYMHFDEKMPQQAQWDIVRVGAANVSGTP